MNSRCTVLLVLLCVSVLLLGGGVGVEGEDPKAEQMNRHPWYDQVKREEFSGGDFISNFHSERVGSADYEFTVSAAGSYTFWVRANPVQAELRYALNDTEEVVIDLGRQQRGSVNVAADGKPDLRFLAWSKVGLVRLDGGRNTIRFRMTSANSHHGYLDCFVFIDEPFQPQGATKPDEMAAEIRRLAEAHEGWVPFQPEEDSFTDSALLDLRYLNEAYAGEHGYVHAEDGCFRLGTTGEPVRFWAVNGPPQRLRGEELRRCARMLAKRGVNLVRIHGGIFDEDGEVDTAKVRHAFEVVDAMKAEGIYSHFSIYFPLWLRPKPGTPWLEGYDGQQHPFAALMFNPDFQAQYYKWWRALLTTPHPETGRTLAEEPAVAMLEIQNEDSFFFWTFVERNIPDPQLRMLEKQFGDWALKRYGSPEGALAKWEGQGVQRDTPAEGRLGFRPIWNMFNERTRRDQDTVRFLYELQTRFYSEAKTFLRNLGYEGLITASNWTTASPEYLGPLEKLSYTAGDFIDRHGYFDCNLNGENAAWSIRNGHTWSDRSAYRFDASEPGKPRVFFHPAMDPHYNHLPSMISETTWCRPNRFRSEAPIYLSVYGALQHSDAIVHFALDGADWAVKPGFWMQPWTLMSPAMMGQFPATALIYRRGLVATGAVVADVQLNNEDLLRLKGTPLPQGAGLDELRLQDVPEDAPVQAGQPLNPLLHYVGRANVDFVPGPGSLKVSELRPYIDAAAQTVSSTTGELRLDYGRGWLRVNAPAAQGVSGLLSDLGEVETTDLRIQTGLELAHILAVAMDEKPLAVSGRILLQVMSEEMETNRRVEAAGENVWRLIDIGTDPWRFRALTGRVKFKRPDAAQLRVTALDLNGYPEEVIGSAENIALRPATLYYLIER